MGEGSEPTPERDERDDAPAAPVHAVNERQTMETHAGSGRISDEPVINAIHHRLIEAVFAVYAAVLVYISFVPFDFTRHPPPRSGPGLVWGLALVPFNLPDIFANIALYVPLGALAFAVCRRRKLGRLLSGAAAIISASVLSFAIEQGQHWVVSRVSTWVDVTANIIGGVLGLVLVATWEGRIHQILTHARQTVRLNTPLTLAKVMVCVILLAHLRPYDVVVDVYHTAAGLRHADVSPLAGWQSLPEKVSRESREGRRQGMHELPRAQWEYGLDHLATATMYAILAALMVVGLASQSSSRSRLYLWAGFVAVSLAAMITVMRIFLISHGLDTFHLLCGLVGWPLGCGVAHVMLRGESRDPRVGTAEQTASSHIRQWQTTAIGAALAMVIVYELVPFDFGSGAGEGAPPVARQICLLPFEAHFNSRPNDAIYDISGELLRYGLVGACLALLARRRTRTPWQRQLRRIVAATGATAVAMECLHLIMATHITDVTTVLLAMAGGFGGAVAVRWAHDYHASLQVLVSDDLLTRQLIEGDTYTELPAARPPAAADQRQIAEHE